MLLGNAGIEAQDVIRKKDENLNHKINNTKTRQLEAFKRLINLGMGLFCLALEIVIFAYHWLTHFAPSLVDDLHFYFWGYVLEIGLYATILIFFSYMYGGLRFGYLKNIEIIFSKLFATLIANVLIYVQLSLMALQLFIPRFFVQMMFLQCIGDVLWIAIANRIYHTIFPPRQLLLVHGERPIELILQKFKSRKDKYEVAKCLHIHNGCKKICNEILTGYREGEYQAVIIGDISVESRNMILKFCYANSIRFYIMPKITDVILMGAEPLHIFDTPLLLTREYSLSVEQRFIKRLIDIVLAFLLTVITSPLMLLTAAAIKLYDGGPILYKQIRATINQKEFHIMKFRSMYLDAEGDGVARLASKGDQRITPVGKIIRKIRVDELPQLFNILRGDMTFIGPRPERPEIIAQYVEIMPEFAFRMKVKAGLAGYAQVYGKYNTTPYDKLKLDLFYIENYSIWMDCKLMLLTLKVLFWPDSTEGVEAEQVTAFRETYLQKEKEE
jgi:exopolysaccharide biosynthesis polyprenyl glycosylphosphotransferase